MISAPSATTPQARETVAGAANAGLNSQAAGFGDMFQVLLMALVPAALVGPVAPAPQPEGQMAGATGPTPTTDDGIGGSARNLVLTPGWCTVPRFSADTATCVLEAKSGQAPAVPVTDGKGAYIDLAAFELLEASRTIKAPDLAGDGQARTDGSRVAKAPIGTSLLDAVVSSATRAEQAPVIPAGGDGPPRVLWKLTAGYGLETAGLSRADTPRPGGLGETSTTPADNVSSDGRTAPRASSQSSDGTGTKEGSANPQNARGQGEAVRPVSPDGTPKLDPSLIGLTRLDTLAGDRVRPSGVQPGQDAGGMPAQAVFEAIADRAQVARLRGENLARFELATSDGNTIRVRIAVTDNVVSARIDVTSTTMRDVLVQHTPELSQRLQAGGLVPAAIQVSLIGGRETGSERHNRRQESGRSNGYHEIDVANPTLIETDDVGFEKWA
jgi:hypothetical protein